MKKGPLVAAVAGVIVVIGVLMLLFGSGKDESPTSSSSTGSNAVSSAKALDACELFTEAEAQEVMPGAKKGDQSPDASTEDINVSTCSYTNNATTVADIKVATVVARSALTDTGVDSNKAVFGEGMPAGSEMVTGYGSDAYFTPALGQLNVLKDNNWIIISYGGTRPAENTLANAQLIADKLDIKQ